MDIDKRLDEIEATLASISNIISQTVVTDNELEAARLEIFNETYAVRLNTETTKNVVTLIEQRIRNV